MYQMRKYLTRVLVAYATCITLLLIHWSAKAWLYKHCFNLLMQGKHGHPVSYPNLTAIYSDFGLDHGMWVYWYVRLADQAKLLAAAAGFVFTCLLILPRYFKQASRDGMD